MKTLWIVQAVSAAVLAGVAVWARGAGVPRRFFWQDLLTALLLPGVGPVALAVQIALEAAFRRTARPVAAEELFDDEEADRPESPRADPLEDLRIGLSAEPFEDVLRAADPVRLELAFQRLSRSDSAAAVACLKEALNSPERDLRVRARAVLARMEDRLVRILRRSTSPLERARAGGLLACMSPDGPTARLHLERACRELHSALAGSDDPELRLELARALLSAGDAGRAREILGVHIRRAPRDPRGYALRMQASLVLSDRAALLQDAVVLGPMRGGRS